MGNCKYCGKPAGLFRGKHALCEMQFLEQERLHQVGLQQILTEVVRVIKEAVNLDEFEKSLTEIERSFSLQKLERNPILARGWEIVVEQFLEDGILDEGEVKRLVEFTHYFSISKDDLDKNGALTRLRQFGQQQIITEVARVINEAANLDEFERSLAAIERSTYLLPLERKSHIARGWEVAVEQFLEDGILDEGEEKRLVAFQNYFSLSQDDLDKYGAQTWTAKAGILRNVLEGKSNG